MTTRMLIDARHPEETRVAVLKGNRIEEFDFESADRKQIKGNIYLAKVTRVEPSLQAAFVDFGGNRHGFLAFSEIHPDYYQIPKQDRDALLAEEAEHAEEEARLLAVEEAEEERSGGREAGGREGIGRDDADKDEDGASLAEELAGDDGVTEVDTAEADDVATIEGGDLSASDHDENDEDDRVNGDGERGGPRRGRRQGRGAGGTRAKASDEARAKRMALRRRYKIQDVIQRRQVLLVQVVKEERGNKGAALTTYLSLAGRYCVLMPNSSHGGGISRKISSAADRKRLKQIVSELDLPKSMGCIVRTAGLSRTKTEIKRDFDYLARLWDEIRENTLKSVAPALIHSDSDLIKRAIRDIYSREIEEVVVEGDDGYRAAREFMKLLMPSHARRVKQYADPVPLFQRYGAEDQLSAMYDPVVQLKSGGYLVINPTEALVSIDINSGRSTKEHGIEATALNTNLEAAREIARQLRLRDMAGLVVIDFIDMDHGSNVRKVEKCMKEALKNDRARIQVGRISGFGLMEMSRQRLRTGVLEATTRTCPHCDGTGLVRTAASAGLSALRLIEDEAAKGKGSVIQLFASQEAAIYLLNAKRADLAEIEARYGVRVEVMPEGENEGAKMRVASTGPKPDFVPRFEPIPEPVADDIEVDDEDDREEAEAEEAEAENRDTDASNGESGRRKRRRRRGGRRNRGDRNGENGDEYSDEADTGEDAASDAGQAIDPAADTAAGADAVDEAEDDGAEPQRKRRKRPRRRRGSQEGDGETDVQGEVLAGDDALTEEAAPDLPDAEPAPRRPSRRKRIEEAEAPEPKTGSDGEADDDAAAAPAKPARARRRKPRVDAGTGASDAEAGAEATDAPTEAGIDSGAEEAATPSGETEASEKAPRRRTRRRPAAEKQAEPETAPAIEAEPAAEQSAEIIADADALSGTVAANDSAAEEDDGAAGESEADAAGEAPRRGWWQRTFGN